MELILQRIDSTIDDTIGKLFDEDNNFFCNTMEDEFRAVKVAKETRIWAGRYKLGIRQEITDKTNKYLKDPRLKPWFERHIEILNVPQFRGVYIHLGNDDDDTDACVLLGIWRDHTKRSIESSVITYKKFYTKYYPLLKEGVDIYLNILDEINKV